MKSKIIEEGENLHHLFVKGIDVWLSDDELKQLQYDMETYACLHGLDKI